MKNKKSFLSTLLKEIPDLSLNNYFNLSYFAQSDKNITRYGGIYVNSKEKKNFLLLTELFNNKQDFQDILKETKKKGSFLTDYRPNFVYIKKYFSEKTALSYSSSNKIATVFNLVNDNEEDIIKFINLVKAPSLYFPDREDVALVDFLPDSVNQCELSSIYIWSKNYKDDSNVHTVRYVHCNYHAGDKRFCVRIHFFCKCYPEKFINHDIFLRGIDKSQYTVISYENRDYYNVVLTSEKDESFKYHLLNLDKKNKYILELMYNEELERNKLLSFINKSRIFLDNYSL